MSDAQPPTQAGGSPSVETVPAVKAKDMSAPDSGQVRSRRGRNRSSEPKPAKASRAGRNLPAAIAVGVILLGSLLIGLLFFPFAIVVIAVAFAAVGVWEVSRALEVRGMKVPLVPVLSALSAVPSPPISHPRAQSNPSSSPSAADRGVAPVHSVGARGWTAAIGAIGLGMN